MTFDPRHPLVLVVDDDADTRDLYRLVLEAVGYRVEDAGYVKAAAAKLDGLVPDVVLTDWLLPDGVGLDVCEALAARGASRHVPVVAVTGLALNSEVEARARARGVVTLLEKPADPDVILAAVRDALMLAMERLVRAAAARTKRYAGHMRRASPMAPAGAPGGALADPAALLERAAARSGQAITLVIADDTAHYIAVGGAARELTGYEPGEIAGLSVWDLTPVSQAYSSQRLWEQFIAAGVQEGHYILRRRDGAPIEAQYCAMANIAPGWHVSAIAERPLMPGSISGV